MVLKQFNKRSTQMGYSEVTEEEFDEINRAYNSLARINMDQMIKIFWTDKLCFQDLLMLSDLHYMSNKLQVKIIAQVQKKF